MKILTLIVLSVALMCLLEGVDSQKKMKKRKALLKGIPKECRKLMRKQKKKKHATAQQINSCLNATVFEGDVKLTDRQQKLIDTLIGKYNKTDQEAHSIMKRGASAYSGKWTEYKVGNNYIVPYIIDGSMSAKGSRLVERASELLAAVTCLRLMPRSEPTVQKNYIRYFVGGGCYSYVGKVGGRQDISIGRGCEYESTVVHETMHALGFWHEQSRKDRDNYVRVLLENVLPGTEFNFEKYEHGEIDSLGSPYDTMSVMHYDGYAFTKNRKPTIVDKDNGQAIVAGEKMSTEDIKQINLLYNCPTATTQCTASDLPNIVGDGYIVETKQNFDGGENVNLRCGEGYEVDGPSTAKCEKGAFAPPTLVCKKVEVVEDCADTNKYCGYWSRQGFCQGRYEPYMKRNCKESCSLCGSCPDGKSSCERWAELGYCDDDNRYHLYMFRHCKQSCNVCGQCKDFSARCASYKEDGLCENSRYTDSMHYYCAKTCNFCQ